MAYADTLSGEVEGLAVQRRNDVRAPERVEQTVRPVLVGVRAIRREEVPAEMRSRPVHAIRRQPWGQPFIRRMGGTLLGRLLWQTLQTV